ncbi:MAG: hypothetical protein KJ968_01350, partial [Nanoarchaeota archaeon]|nr:hypothetical protein [Nanoarchaeota archaeon]
LIFNSKKELLKHFKQVDEIILSGKFNMVPLCMYSNNLNLEDYIIEFIYQKNSDLMINVQNKSYEEASSEEIGQIVTGYFDKMSQALVCRDQGEFKDTKRKLLDFAAESPSKDYIPKICDLLLEADKKQSSMIGYHFTLMMQAVENQEYLIAGHHKKRLTEIENTLNEKQITNILKLGIKKINHQQ